MTSMRVAMAFYELEGRHACHSLSLEAELVDELAFQGRGEAIGECVVVAVID